MGQATNILFAIWGGGNRQSQSGNPGTGKRQELTINIDIEVAG